MGLDEPVVRRGRAYGTGMGFLAIQEARGKSAFGRSMAGSRDFDCWLLDQFSGVASVLAAGRRDRVLEILGAKSRGSGISGEGS